MLARWLDLGEVPGWWPEPIASAAKCAVLAVAPESGATSGRVPTPGAEPSRRPEAAAKPLRWPVLSGALVALAIGLWFTFGAAPEAWVFDRGAIAAGEWWRLASGHWVHSDASHAALNIAALALIAPIVESASRRLLVAALAFGTLAVSAGIACGVPEIDRYCGLSGLLNTLFVAALAVLWQRHRHPILLVIGGGLLVKLALELFRGSSLVVATAWPSVPAAHLAGVLGGLALLVLLALRRFASSKAVQVPDSRPGLRIAHAPTAAPRTGPAVANDGVGVLTSP